MISVDVALLTFVLGSLVPLVVAILTKANASSGIKAVANVVLSIVAAVCTDLIAQGGKASVIQVLTVAIAAYVASGVTYTHFWKPTGIAPALQTSTAEFGVGG